MKIHHLFWGICLCFSTNVLFAQNYQKTSSGIKTTVNAVDIEVQFFAPAVARIIKSPEGVAYEKESLFDLEHFGDRRHTPASRLWR